MHTRLSNFVRSLGVLLAIAILPATTTSCSNNSTKQSATPRSEPQKAKEDPPRSPSEQPSAGPRKPATTADALPSGIAPADLQTLSEQELADGWISLFDGKTLYGWRAFSNADWRVENGAITVSSGDGGLLCQTTPFSNYVLKLEFRSASGTNSGIFLRTPSKPSDLAGDCYELNIADSDNPFPTCSLVKRQKAEGNFDSDDWQAYEVTLDGPRVTVKLDGKVALEYSDPNPLPRGFIGLQLNQGKVEFRNIKLKPLGLQTIFNGKDLEGWTEYPEMESKFSVTDAGEMNVKNGRGQLETKTPYANFILQLECISHAPQLNSGIFFRCIPGQTMNGYESQIHNGFSDQDRTKPVDCGTGGFFRRQHARFIVADDGTWFYKTLIADGPHMAAWVNGIQVSDWTDERPPHENPRKGLRREGGTIMIQGHDPTTDLSFRNLRIVEQPTQ